jgi:hypothetical protein
VWSYTQTEQAMYTSLFFSDFCRSFVPGRSQGGCPRCPGTPLGQKIPGGGYRAEKLFARAKIFSRWRAPPLAYFWLRHWLSWCRVDICILHAVLLFQLRICQLKIQ